MATNSTFFFVLVMIFILLIFVGISIFDSDLSIDRKTSCILTIVLVGIIIGICFDNLLQPLFEPTGDVIQEYSVLTLNGTHITYLDHEQVKECNTKYIFIDPSQESKLELIEVKLWFLQSTRYVAHIKEYGNKE